MHGEKHIVLIDFANILEKQTFQKTVKFIMANFYKIDFMNNIVILIKVDEM